MALRDQALRDVGFRHLLADEERRRYLELRKDVQNLWRAVGSGPSSNVSAT